jgi:hypothetical protein
MLTCQSLLVDAIRESGHYSIASLRNLETHYHKTEEAWHIP